MITRADIAASGARTVQQLLSHITGAILFDQIGNGVQTTFDLRGFTGGGITVLVDGARINDPRNNSVQLETIGLDSIERIEIVRGAAAATVGGGSAAGVVNILTRAGSGPARAVVTGSYGSLRDGRSRRSVLPGRVGHRSASGARVLRPRRSARVSRASDPERGVRLDAVRLTRHDRWIPGKRGRHSDPRDGRPRLRLRGRARAWR